MIAYLRGRLASVGSASAVIEVAGVGYRLGMPTLDLAALGPVGSEITVYTSMIVRDDALLLYGFASEPELQMFERLLTVSGVGPKVALSALSSFAPEALEQLIVDEDVKRLSSVSGLGKKTAQRLILELAGVLSTRLADAAAEAAGASGGNGGPALARKQAIEALMGMGFTSAEADLALKSFDGAGDDVAGMLRHALKRLGQPA